MTKTKLLAAAAIMTSLMATPVLAQNMQRETSQNTSQLKKQQMKNPNVRTSNRGYRANGGYDDRMGFNDGYNRSNTGTGFFPIDAAAGIVGGAVNTAGAIASAPFGDDNYANNDGYRTNDGYGVNGGYRDSFAQVNNSGRVGAFATAPYTNPYEYNRVSRNDGWNNDGWNGGWQGQSYSQRNGFVCEPGSVYTTPAGVSMLCQ